MATRLSFSRRSAILRKALKFMNAEDWRDYGNCMVFGWTHLGESGHPGLPSGVARGLLKRSLLKGDEDVGVEDVKTAGDVAAHDADKFMQMWPPEKLESLIVATRLALSELFGPARERLEGDLGKRTRQP